MLVWLQLCLSFSKTAVELKNMANVPNLSAISANHNQTEMHRSEMVTHHNWLLNYGDLGINPHCPPYLSFFPKLKLISNIWQICLIFLQIIAKLKKDKMFGSQMITHLNLSADCLTSVILPFTLTALIIGSCLCCVLTEAFKLGILLSLCGKKIKVHCSPILEVANICTMQVWTKSYGSKNEWPLYWS